MTRGKWGLVVREEEPTADIGSGKDLKIGNRFTKEGTQWTKERVIRVWLGVHALGDVMFLKLVLSLVCLKDFISKRLVRTVSLLFNPCILQELTGRWSCKVQYGPEMTNGSGWTHSFEAVILCKLFHKDNNFIIIYKTTTSLLPGVRSRTN